LGVDPNSPIELTETLDQLMAKVQAENAPANGFNIENNPLYKMTETGETISEKMVKMEQAAYLPTLTGFYSYNQKFLTTGFDMTPKNIAGFSMSIPVFSSGMRKHKVNEAKINFEKAQINKSMVTDQLTMQEQQLKLDLNTALENFKSQKENVAVAKRAFDNINRKYEQGMVSSLDLTQANSNYLQAETNYIQSTFALVQAQIKLDKLYNQL
jgi:outer membrane protein